MRLLVCIKQVPVSDAGGMDAARGVLRRDVGEKRMNPHDAAALEAGLRLRDAEGGTLDVLSMGPSSAQDMLKETLAVGADGAILLCGAAFAGADVLATARTLAKAAVWLGGYDAILGGAFTTDGGTGHTIATMAALMDIPCFTCTSDIRFADGRFRFTQELTCMVQYVHSAVPTVFAVDASAYTLRVPTLSRRLAARSKAVQLVTPKELSLSPEICGLNGSPTRVKRVETIQEPAAAPPLYGDADSLAKQIVQVFSEASV